MQVSLIKASCDVGRVYRMKQNESSSPGHEPANFLYFKWKQPEVRDHNPLVGVQLLVLCHREFKLKIETTPMHWCTRPS